VYVRNGISIVEIENVGAPYFVGRGKCPWEEILVIGAVAQAVRAAHPKLPFGMHILSSNELETLPLAIQHGAFFVRSEATLFRGERPEGTTDNSGNLARFMYARNVLHGIKGTQSKAGRRFPQVWSDMQKKHTVFPSELANLDTWLANTLFMKLEGVILTGAETGSNVAEGDLRKARTAVDNALRYARTRLRADVTIPLVTGSGENFAMYAKYADFIIVGTKLKERSYWENDVLEANVIAVVQALRGVVPVDSASEQKMRYKRAKVRYEPTPYFGMYGHYKTPAPLREEE
jgi:predicted TIM-barrel enzyme